MFNLRIFAVCAVFALASPSAIPMWEYLTKIEKVMYLYNMFQSQVQDYCKTSSCKQDLKNYGWSKLKGMSEDHLDEMDPFQRGSNDIIWESVLEGHAMMKTTDEPKPTTTPKPNSYEDDSFYDVDASAKIDSGYRLPPPTGFVFANRQLIVESGIPEYKRPDKNNYFGTSSNGIQESTTADSIPLYESYGSYERIPLTGPWVVKVHPDGSPVRESTQRAPEDDDLRLYQMTKGVLQNL